MRQRRREGFFSCVILLFFKKTFNLCLVSNPVRRTICIKICVEIKIIYYFVNLIVSAHLKSNLTVHIERRTPPDYTFFLFFFLFENLGSPILGLIGEKTERLILGLASPFSMTWRKKNSSFFFFIKCF